MAIHVTCTSCGRVSSLPENLVGKTVRCQHCRHIFVGRRPGSEEEELEDVLPCDDLTTTDPPRGRSRSRGEAERDDLPRGRGAPRTPRRYERGPALDSPSGRFPLGWVLAGVGAAACVLVALGLAALWLFRSAGATPPANAVVAGVGNAAPPPPDFPPGPAPGLPAIPFLNAPPGGNPPPGGMAPARRPAFDDKFARQLALANNQAGVRGRFDDGDPADRDGRNPAKIFFVQLQAGEAYLGELRCADAFADPALRLEDRGGKALATGRRRHGQGPVSFVFVPPRADTYRLVASARPEAEFELALKQVQEGDPLPDLDAGTEKPPRRSIALIRKLDHFLSATIAPDSRSAWVSWPNKRLELISCTDFVTKATYKVTKRCYRVAVDGRGMLYAVAQRTEPGQLPLPWWDFGIADLQVFDTRTFGPAGGEVTPKKTIPVGGIITHLCLSPDDNWLYYLDTHNRKVGKVNLKDGSEAGSTGAIAGGTNGLCLTPDGKKLYTCSSNNVVQVLDPATLKVEKTIHFDDVSPTGLQATDKGNVFLNSGKGQWTHIYLLYAARDYQGEKAKAIPWAGVYHTHSLALSPDQQVLYSACFSLSPSNIQAFHIPPRPTLTKGQECGAIGLDGVNAQGQMVVSRDGRFMFCDRGLILHLGR